MTNPTDVGHFLGGIGALVWDPATHRYLLLQRVENRDFKGGAWECVTGRVDQGESYEQALYREVREEIGVTVQIEFLVATTHFYRGEPRPENELLGVIYSCITQDPQQAHFEAEHSAQRWVTADEALAFLPEGHWLRSVILRAERLRMLVPAELRQAFLREGFEL
jgi:8-oxo-dGTP pyrophosphatase MutT (NUDIX family)